MVGKEETKTGKGRDDPDAERRGNQQYEQLVFLLSVTEQGMKACERTTKVELDVPNRD